ncbi:hypothetical protein [Synechococcus sp. NB0720_010]|uniref:hypothetical protein n=1 Tax=Synechococcus sp. NB0720_010 TaxID=2907159 RepID=UPI001FF9710B|nr:hypothetical protein [Synechococcus sp. NB0720_010]UPH90526.1 hypothetical protein LY254_02115 [Synechococcus sp. NB0720_010]
MPRNKYQRRRGMRPSTTAPSAAQTELLQHPVQLPHSSTSSADVGREAARQVRETNNPNTRFIDKPDASTNKNVLRDAYNRQQAASRSVQRQVLGEASTASLKPSGRYVAPSVPPRLSMQLVAKGGAMRLMPVPAIGANIAAGVAAYAIERAAQPALEYLGEKLARGLYSGYEAIFGDTDGMTFDELQEHHRKIEQEYLTRIQGQTNEGLNPPEATQALNKPVLEAPVTTPKPPVNQPKVALPAEMEKQTQPQFDERNREYQIRRAALGDNPTKEEMDAVVAYGLEQHRINFPHLYD